jgi:hypothetical protein
MQALFIPSTHEPSHPPFVPLGTRGHAGRTVPPQCQMRSLRKQAPGLPAVPELPPIPELPAAPPPPPVPDPPLDPAVPDPPPDPADPAAPPVPDDPPPPPSRTSLEASAPRPEPSVASPPQATITTNDTVTMARACMPSSVTRRMCIGHSDVVRRQHSGHIGSSQATMSLCPSCGWVRSARSHLVAAFVREDPIPA